MHAHVGMMLALHAQRQFQNTFHRKRKHWGTAEAETRRVNARSGRPARNLLPARARQLDRNVPQGGYHGRASIGGSAPDAGRQGSRMRG
jgi:hypothetical protein